jgi:spermidine synthase
MYIPFWKKWLSYITPVYLEAAGSDQNPELSVLLNQGRLQLLSGNAIYSWDDLYRNFTIAFETLKIENRHIPEVLVLGLGLGSVPFMLEKKFHKDCHFTAVEWDETIAELASRYTLSRMKSPVDIIVADAEVFVDVCSETFDLIVIDIFEDDLTPPQFEEPEFLRTCHHLLNKGGLLMFNRLHGDGKDKIAAERFFNRVFGVVFPTAWYIDTKGNWILCYQKS